MKAHNTVRLYFTIMKLRASWQKPIKAKLNQENVFGKPVVTEIVPAIVAFYKAEDYHQNYYNDNGEQPYCSYVIKPKLDKFRKVFKEKLKH